MSKSTKIIAALGVAAGLGVAALPAATFAAETVQTVPLKVVVADSFELSVTSTADTTDPETGEVTKGAFTGATGVALAAGASDNASSSTILAKSNRTGGYKVTVAGTGSDWNNGTTLKRSATDADGIAPYENPVTYDGFENYSTTTGWGIRIASSDEGVTTGNFNATTYTGVSGTNNIIEYSETTSGNAGKSVVANYGVSLKDGQPAGTYIGNITYTLVNPAVETTGSGD